MTDETQEQPTPQESPATSGNKDERMWAMLCHLTAFAGFIGIPFGNILGPLIIWLIKKEEMPLVNDQGKESLNFQISVSIVGIALAILSIIPIVGCITLLLLVAVAIAAIVFVILASLAANNGEQYRYPLTIRLLK